MKRIFVPDHPCYGMRSDAHVHVHEGLHVDFASTEMRLDNLETCSLTYCVLLIELQKKSEIFGHIVIQGISITYFLECMVGLIGTHNA